MAPSNPDNDCLNPNSSDTRGFSKFQVPRQTGRLADWQ